MEAIVPLLIAKVLDGLTVRYKATAQNIANANTPQYRPLQVRFEESLRAAAAQGPGAIAQVKAKTELAPMPRLASEMRLDLEIATASQTAMRYAALIDVLGRRSQLMRAVISGGR